MGRPGENTFAASSSKMLTISGGTIVVNASGDGLDSNGSIQMSGGTVYVSGPTSNGNGVLDYDGTFEVSGGLLVATGSTGMAQSPTDRSTQASIVMSYSQTQAAGTVVRLEDESGNEIASFAPAKDYQMVVVSAPELKQGSAYTLYSGETKVVSFETASVVTWLNESGVTEAQAGHFGGGGGFGGARPARPGGTPPEGAPLEGTPPEGAPPEGFPADGAVPTAPSL